MRLHAAPSAKKQNTCLHLLLVAGVFLYLYSPFLDHWLGNEAYARPHTHTHFSETVISQISHHSETDSSRYSAHQDQHKEGVLCFLDIDALLGLLLDFNVVPHAQHLQHLPLVFELVPFYLHVSTIYLSLLDPPPNI